MDFFNLNIFLKILYWYLYHMLHYTLQLHPSFFTKVENLTSTKLIYPRLPPKRSSSNKHDPPNRFLSHRALIITASSSAPQPPRVRETFHLTRNNFLSRRLLSKAQSPHATPINQRAHRGGDSSKRAPRKDSPPPPPLPHSHRPPRSIGPARAFPSSANCL